MHVYDFLSGVNRGIVEAAINAGMWDDDVTPPRTDRSEGLKNVLMSSLDDLMSSHLFWYLKGTFSTLESGELAI